jgi:hypothetical protein
VAGSLDRTVDPGAVFAIAPTVAGAVDWRDPVTLRFRPAAPLTPNTSYTTGSARWMAPGQPRRSTWRWSKRQPGLARVGSIK